MSKGKLFATLLFFSATASVGACAQFKSMLGESSQPTQSNATTNTANDNMTNASGNAATTSHTTRHKASGAISSTANNAPNTAMTTNAAEGYTKSMAEIVSTYASLDPKLFPLPYDSDVNREYYITGQNDIEANERVVAYLLESFGRAQFNKGRKIYPSYQVRNDHKFQPLGFFTVNAYLAEYLADPSGEIPYRHLVDAITIVGLYQSFIFPTPDAYAGINDDLNLKVNVPGKYDSVPLFSNDMSQYIALDNKHPMISDGSVRLIEYPHASIDRWKRVITKATESSPHILKNKTAFIHIINYGNALADRIETLNQDNPDSYDLYALGYQLNVVCSHAQYLTQMAFDRQDVKNYRDAYKALSTRCEKLDDTQTKFEARAANKLFIDAHTVTMAQLPKAVQRDASLEADFRRLWGEVYGPKVKIERVDILDKHWTYIFDILGRLRARYISAGVLIDKGEDVKYYNILTVEQPKTGDGFGKSKARGSTFRYYVTKSGKSSGKKK